MDRGHHRRMDGAARLSLGVTIVVTPVRPWIGTAVALILARVVLGLPRLNGRALWPPIWWADPVSIMRRCGGERSMEGQLSIGQEALRQGSLESPQIGR